MRDDPVPGGRSGHRPHRRGSERIRAVPDRPQPGDAARRRAGRGLPSDERQGRDDRARRDNHLPRRLRRGDHADGRTRPGRLVARSASALRRAIRGTRGREPSPLDHGPRPERRRAGDLQGRGRAQRGGLVLPRAGRAPRLGIHAPRTIVRAILLRPADGRHQGLSQPRDARGAREGRRPLLSGHARASRRPHFALRALSDDRGRERGLLERRGIRHRRGPRRPPGL